MGRDKASIPWPTRDSPTLAERTAALLAAVCPHAVEVGPGHTTLARVTETAPGSGPLAAMVEGWEHLVAAGWDGRVLVVATDLPLLTAGLLQWLVDCDGRGSVVPVAGGRVQPLCARYSPADLRTARRLVANGERAMTTFVRSIDAALAPETDWRGPAGGEHVLSDADTPQELGRRASR
jgi:molybdenum cofactor guanylyltransferase